MSLAILKGHQLLRFVPDTEHIIVIVQFAARVCATHVTGREPGFGRIVRECGGRPELEVWERIPARNCRSEFFDVWKSPICVTTNDRSLT